MTTQAIMKKVTAKERHMENYLKCLKISMCPDCGRKMTLKVYGSDDQYSDHACTSCEFSAEAEVLY